MNPQKLNELRDYYDNNSTADNEAPGTWETDVQEDPMVTTSLRLPKSVLDWVRAEARSQHAKPTQLIRQWIEERQHGSTLHTDERLARLEHAVFYSVRTGDVQVSTPREPVGEDVEARPFTR